MSHVMSHDEHLPHVALRNVKDSKNVKYMNTNINWCKGGATRPLNADIPIHHVRRRGSNNISSVYTIGQCISAFLHNVLYTNLNIEIIILLISIVVYQ